ncbi:PREDICTED: N-acetylglucosamine-6-sulfatase-like, partial [Ceratosolen solmsi marchali]|uniref:N-acetylglucosamine-6-sulfatase-like n=1 Tax=Ceratosolen solmsi marchali TaxID=326594 RepID=A0AAJ7DXS3_9HYME
RLFFFFISVILTCTGKNIILIVTDDLDLILDGMTPLKSTTKLIRSEGVVFQNAFAAVPVCCPNRASILTGKYQHNHRALNNSLEGGCNSPKWQQTHGNTTFAAILNNELNYKTFYAGKYLNKYGHKNAGGVAYVPPGWDKWYGLVGNSKYYDYSLSINGVEKKYGSKPNNYLTDVIKKFSNDFIKSQNKKEPFLMMLAPPAPHEPFTAAPRHKDKFEGVRAKRTKNFNISPGKGKHWLVRMGLSPLPLDIVKSIDEIYRKRWQTLLAVDELVESVYMQLKSQDLLDNTYIIFTSDNGFHVGQFSMPYDKRQPYETDIRVPLLIRGPGISPNSEVQSAVSSVDLFATIMDIAGLQKPSDGTSLLKSAIKDRTVLIEYKGERSEGIPQSGCETDSDRNLNVSLCKKDFACKCQDSINNTYTCIRRVADDVNNIFCRFYDNEKFIEFYDLSKDEFQLDNLSATLNNNKRHRFRKRLENMSLCQNQNCIKTGKKN